MRREIRFRGKAVAFIEGLNELEIPHENGWVYGAYGRMLGQRPVQPLYIDSVNWGVNK